MAARGSRFRREKFGMEVKATLGICICARTTTATIRQEADDEHKEQDPKLRTQIHARVPFKKKNFLNCDIFSLANSTTLGVVATV